MKIANIIDQHERLLKTIQENSPAHNIRPIAIKFHYEINCELKELISELTKNDLEAVFFGKPTNSLFARFKLNKSDLHNITFDVTVE